MRIAIDARSLSASHLRGIGKYLFEILQEGVRHDDLEFVLLSEDPIHPAHRPSGPRIMEWVQPIRGDRFRVWEQLVLPLRAWTIGCDILHAAGMWAPVWQPLPTIVTVHDVLPWRETESGFFLRNIAPASYRSARAIIAVSANSKQDIASLWPDLAEKTVVITHGVDDRYRRPHEPLPQPLIGIGVKEPYFLYFGGDAPRKRLEWAIRVWRALDRTGVRLVVCGLEPWAIDRWRQVVPGPERDLMVCLQYIDEEWLPSLYAHAVAVLYPTVYEGFGFPALESQAVGTPVLLSAVGSLCELLGPGAMVLPVDNFEAWVAASRRLLSGERPDELAARQWASRFTWREAFEHTLEVYHQATRR
jgi:glycosyltransferase involved in cell wall biosynthesis